MYPCGFPDNEGHIGGPGCPFGVKVNPSSRWRFLNASPRRRNLGNREHRLRVVDLLYSGRGRGWWHSPENVMGYVETRGRLISSIYAKMRFPISSARRTL